MEGSQRRLRRGIVIGLDHDGTLTDQIEELLEGECLAQLAVVVGFQNRAPVRHVMKPIGLSDDLHTVISPDANLLMSQDGDVDVVHGVALLGSRSSA
jgi:hypothetical protein